MALVLVAGLLAACAPDRPPVGEVRDAVSSTARQPFRFVYTDEIDERTVTVQGFVEDDFRYQARLLVDGRPVLDEIVVDDAIAVRVIDPDVLGLYGSGRAPDRERTNGEPSVAEALTSRRWIVDPAGAPNLLTGGEERRLGDDPIYDALTVFRYVTNTVATEGQYVRFNRSDFSYRPQDDPFPVPEEGSEVVRYDIRPPRLPRASDAAAAGNQAVPDTVHFRKLAVYVRDGVVIRILEDIDVEGRLDEIERNYDLQLPPELSAAERSEIAMSAINAVRRGQGDPTIRVRRMSFEVVDLGDPVHIALPDDNRVEGDLAVLIHRGRSNVVRSAADAS